MRTRFGKVIRFTFALSLAFGFSGSQALAQAEDFNYTINGGTITITGYTGSGGEVTIPDSIDDLPVTSIGNQAFISTSVTSVTIPGSVTSMESSAFHDCTSLTSIIIPNSVTSILDGAFTSCLGLTNVVRGSSVTNIGKVRRSGRCEDYL